MHFFWSLQNALKSANEKIISERLTVSDRCLAWLAYIHLIEFGILPVKFYDPANVGPSRIMNKEPFLIPWQTVQDVKTDPDTLLAMFEGKIKEVNCSLHYSLLTYQEMLYFWNFMAVWYCSYVKSLGLIQWIFLLDLDRRARKVHVLGT